MRPIVLAVILFAIAPAAWAQDPLLYQRDFEVQTQLQAARQREVDLQNQLTVLDARVRTEQAIRDQESLRNAPAVRIPSDPAARQAPIDPGKLAAIPDDRLAASNARVRAAARNRR
jgi:hypothetical protein